MTSTQTPERLPAGAMPVLRVVPQPASANVHGDVFGGWIMSHVDIAGSIPASRRANGRVVTIAVNSFTFRQPVFIGDLLSFYADIVREGTTSITVNVEVFAQRMGMAADVVKVISLYTTRHLWQRWWSKRVAARGLLTVRISRLLSDFQHEDPRRRRSMGGRGI